MMARNVGIFCMTLALGLASIVGVSAAADRDITGLGYGRCFFGICNCRSFVGSEYTCRNCGHNTSWH